MMNNNNIYHILFELLHSIFLVVILILIKPVESTNNNKTVMKSFSNSGNSGSGNGNSNINFLAIGDWGGVDMFPPDVFHKHPNQRIVANGMATIVARHESRFVISLGDNFYKWGLTFNAKHAKRRIHRTFEQVYTDPALTSIPWYVIAGNHDHKGNVQAQIKYTTNFSRWQFPSLYHSHSISEGDLTVDLILLDTVDLCGMSSDDEYPYKPMPLLSKENAKDQWEWLEQELWTSANNHRADFILVAGHYPMYSVCNHGPTPTLVQHLKPLLEQYNAHYLSGHEHGMLHWQEEETTSDDHTTTTTHYVVNGAGSSCCCDGTANRDNNDWNLGELKWYLDDTRNEQKANPTKGGFLSFQANQTCLQIQYHDETGEILYQPDPIPPRTITTKKKEEQFLLLPSRKKHRK